MDQEVHTQVYQPADFQHFQQQLALETRLLEQLITNGACSEHSPVAGFEIEVWLLDDALRPAMQCNAMQCKLFILLQ